MGRPSEALRGSWIVGSERLSALPYLRVGENWGPVVLWIGIKHQTLSLREGTLLVSECKNLLEEHGVFDVEVEIRESVVVRNAGPAVLSSSSTNPMRTTSVLVHST